jgi:hypothetical protein
MASYQPDQQLSKTARYVAPRYDPRMHTGWTHNMRRFIRDNEPLGFQIIEGEITIREVLDDKKLEEATESLALTRSNSYTMSREVMFSDLFGGALPDEDSDTGSESTDSTSETVRIHRRTRLDPALGETSTAPSKTAQGASRKESAATTPRRCWRTGGKSRQGRICGSRRKVCDGNHEKDT